MIKGNMKDEHNGKDVVSFTGFLTESDTQLQECGDILRRQNHAILGVITSADRLRRQAVQSNLEIIDPSPDNASVLNTTSFDYLFSITHLEKIPDRILDLPRRYAINFHYGPLPRDAGLNAPAQALMSQERQYGACWHPITPAIDQGPVLRREIFAIDPQVTVVSLNTKCLAAGVRILSLPLAYFAGNAVTKEVQVQRWAQLFRQV